MKNIKLAIMTNGGMGNLFIQGNFIYCLHEYLKDESIDWIVFGHKSKELNQAVFRHLDFLSEWHGYEQRGSALSNDVCINLNFYPEVMAASSEAKEACPKLGHLLSAWEKFLQDQSRRYCSSHPDADFNAYLLAILQGKNCLSVGDVTGELGIDENEYSFSMTVEREMVLSSFGLSPGEYITLHRGASALLEQGASPKLWPVEHYEELIRLLKQCFPEKKIVQLGEENSAGALFGVDVSLLGKTGWEELKELLQYSWLHIDTEGGLVHLRKALKTGPSVVLFGPTPREFYGYKGNINISSGKCAHWCARLTDNWSIRCPREEDKQICMKGLSPARVMQEIMRWNCLEKVRQGKFDEIWGSFCPDKLLERLDADYRRDFLWQHDIYYAEMRKVPAANLRAIVMTQKGFQWLPLEETPACRRLAGDIEAYDSYLSLLRERYSDHLHSVERFDRLVQSLEERGYESGTCPVVVDTEGRILDGQHRAAWILSRAAEADIEVLVLHSFYDTEGMFPFCRVKAGSRVVIYGMGKLGRAYACQLGETGFARVVFKVDRCPDEINGIYAPSYIAAHQEDFDVIVIASANKRHLEEIMAALLKIGIPREKIAM